MCDVISIHSSNQLEGIFTAGSKLSKLCDSVFYCDMLWLPFDDHSDAEALTIERTNAFHVSLCRSNPFTCPIGWKESGGVRPDCVYCAHEEAAAASAGESGRVDVGNLMAL
uniref:Uncharacterized protein n=1 Tax=Triticum urartu TaxID=4572 RepID=A0A8R7U2M7_TRIUA